MEADARRDPDGSPATVSGQRLTKEELDPGSGADAVPEPASVLLVGLGTLG